MDRFSLLGKIYYKILYRISRVSCAKQLGVRFGDNLNIYGEVAFGTEPWLISLGNNVFLTNGVRFICHDGGTLLFRKQVPDLEITKPITIGNDVYVGNSVIFLPGSSVGNKVIIGAGAIVSGHIPDNSVAVGVPARVIKTADEYLDKIKEESLHLGHLTGREKDEALKKYYKRSM